MRVGLGLGISLHRPFVGGSPTPTPTPAPAFTTQPSISDDGTPTVGETLTGNDGTVNNGGSVTGRSWLFNGSAISGANGGSYVPTQAGDYQFQNTGTGGIVATSAARTVAAAPAPTPAPISAVAADGWQATMVAPSDLTYDPVALTRQGFTSAGVATSFAETFYTTKRVRQPYPNQGQFTTDTVALSDYVYATDTIIGRTHSSAETSPKPICAWYMPGRMLTGNSCHWEIRIFHRDFRSNRQVACVKVRGNDGTNVTPWQTVAAQTPSTLCDSGNAIDLFQGDLDLSALADGAKYWLEAEAYPFVGADNATYSLSSVRKSEGEHAAGVTAREFGRRYFWKDTARFASPPLAYVSSAGNDSTGVWSTTAATAAATPFLTVGGAMQAVDNASRGTPATGGRIDGCEVRVVNTVAVGTTISARAQTLARMIVTRAPGTTRANALVTMGSNLRTRITAGLDAAAGGEGGIILRDLACNRTATGAAFQGETGNFLSVALQNVNWVAASGVTAAHLSSAHDEIYGLTASGAGFINLNASGSNEHRILRNVVADMNLVAHEQWLLDGCTLTRATAPAIRGTGELGAIVAHNRFLDPNPSTGTQPINIVTTAAGMTVNGFVAWGNLIEDRYTNTASKAMGIASDTPTEGSVYHGIICHNTVTGYGSAGRMNIFYDNGANLKTHRLGRVVGNIVPQINVKGDVFVGSTASFPNPETRLGHFAFHHGVGCQGNFVFYKVNSATALSEEQAYAGPGSVVGASAVTPVVATSVVFTDYRGPEGSAGSVTNSGGTGGGTYTQASGSPAKNIVTVVGCAYDLAGNPLPASNANAGAFA